MHKQQNLLPTNSITNKLERNLANLNIKIIKYTSKRVKNLINVKQLILHQKQQFNK